MRKRELIIIGGGPGGLSAAVYAKRYMLDVEIVSRNIGGTILNAHEVCNILTYQKIKGMELAKKMEEHVKSMISQSQLIMYYLYKKTKTNL